MNKSELIIAMSEKMSVTQRDARRFINVFEGLLADVLKDDEVFMLQGFGTFQLWKQVERQGRNPRTGESCMIRPRLSVKFKPGKGLLEELNQE